jgi:hypothetical protein
MHTTRSEPNCHAPRAAAHGGKPARRVAAARDGELEAAPKSVDAYPVNVSGRQVGQHLAPDEGLTQHGKVLADGTFAFRRMLRKDKEKSEEDLSLIRGRLHPNAAGDVIYGHRGASQLARDAARHTTVERLTEIGFRVEHTPRFPASPLHVSVFWDHGEWDKAVADLFDKCFDEGVLSHLRNDD